MKRKLIVIARKNIKRSMRRKARILIYDVESFPNLAYIWGMYEQNAVHFLKRKKVVMIGWKFFGEKEVHIMCLRDFVGYKKGSDDNRKMMRKWHKILKSADITIAHNGDQFDNKMVNADFIRNGLLPAHPRRSIDTVKVSRLNFGFNSNKLDDLAQELGLPRKRKTGGFSLWLGCMAGELWAWLKMAFYCKGDVILLERLLLKFIPWIPNWADIVDGYAVCAVCSSDKAMSRGWKYGEGFKSRRFRCPKGHWTMGKLEKN